MGDKLSYTLEGRSVTGRPVPKGQDVAAAPCIFCGKTVKHVNDGGNGWLCGSVAEGEPREYLYCEPQCREGQAAEKDGIVVWRCGCVSDYVEVVGKTCHVCGRPRARAIPYRTDECPACDGEHAVYERTARLRMYCRRTKTWLEYGQFGWKEVKR